MKFQHTFCTLLLLAMLHPAFCQDEGPKPLVSCDYDNDSCGVVLALSGLKMRHQPAFDAKAITVIPFSAKVKRLHPQPDLGNPTAAVLSPDAVSGRWETVLYKGKTGYVFSAYLGGSIWKMDQDFYLLMEDAAMCSSDAYASPKYYYYGLFLNKDSTIAKIKKIQPSFISSNDDLGQISIHADEKEKSLFLFASKVPFAEEGPIKKHKVMTTSSGLEGPAILVNNVSTIVNVPNSTWELSSVKQKFNTDGRQSETNSIVLKNTATGQKQILIGKDDFLSHASLTWCGDLDRDGIQDFMIAGGDRHHGFCRIFLSRNPGKGKMMRLAGIYYWGDCC